MTARPSTPAPAGFVRPGRIAAAALVALAVSYLVAIQVPVPRWELRLTTWINGLPDAVATVLYPVMQVGTLAAPLVVAIVLMAWRRDVLLAVVTVAAGVAAWFAAKAIKQLVERGRPRAYLPSIDIREGDGTGLGYVSGHSAVAAATATIVVSALPHRWRPGAVVVAGLVGIGRIVHGVHLPADVVGGWALGTLIGLGAVVGLERLREAHT